MRIYWWLVLAVPLAAATAQAQPAAEPQVQCISHWPGWEASAGDIAAIESVPVPDSFRTWADHLQACTRFPFIAQTLIDWHISFGSRASVAAALAYLENDQMRDLPAPEDYAQALRRAWRGALPDLRRALPGGNPTSASLQRLRLLLAGQARFLILAEQASRAAEEFDSLALLARDQRHLRAAEAGDAFVAALKVHPLRRDLPVDRETDRIAEIRLRDALLRARVTGAATDRARAEALVDAAERPAYRELIGPAFSGGSDFCEIGDFDRNAAALEALCTADEQMQERAVSWAVARAMLALLPGGPDENEDAFVESVVYLLDRETNAIAGRCCRLESGEDLLHLLRYRAERDRRRFEATTDFSRAERHWQGSLGDLRWMESLVSPADSPARWKRIAEAWLEIWTLGAGRAPPAGGAPMTAPPHLERYAAYLRMMLRDLPEITTVSSPGLQRR